MTVKEKVDGGSHYQNLKNGRPIQERWARQLHQEAGVPEGPCGFKELKKFQHHLGPQAYQLIVVQPSKCLIVFKDATFNDAPHFIALVKHQNHYDGLTSIPALITAIATEAIIQRTPATIIVLARIVLPAAAEIRPALIMPHGSNPLLIVPIATVYFMVKIVLMPTR